MSAAPRTLTRTLTIRIVAVAVIAAVAQMIGVFVYYTVRDEKTGVLIALHEAQEIAARVQIDGERIVSVDPHAEFERHYAKYPEDYAIEVVDAKGRVVSALNGALLEGLQVDLDAQPDLWTKAELRGGQKFRVTVKRFDSQSTPFWVAFAIRNDPASLYAGLMIDEMLDHVVEPMLPLFVLMLLVSVMVIRSSLRPLTRAAEAAGRLDPRDHRMRLPAEALPKEIAGLVDAINASLGSLQEVFEHQRQFLAMAAHELRTPLTVLTLGLDHLTGPRLPMLHAEVERMTRLVNQLLLVARLDAVPAPQSMALDLAGLAKTVVARLVPITLLQNRSLEFVDEGDASCRGDGDMISDALRNLVENAIRYAPENTTVRISAGPGARIAVDDAGPGISAVDAARLQQRIWLWPKHTESGAGLGLFIVGKVVGAHDGTVLISTSPLGGACVEMQFPADTTKPAAKPHEASGVAALAPSMAAP